MPWYLRFRESEQITVLLTLDSSTIFRGWNDHFSRTMSLKIVGMPRFKPMAKLERNALADLCKHTLSHIPTLVGRLVYLATLRDVNSGAYRHHGLATAFGRDEAARALRESHDATFQGWLKLSLAEKNEDLREYLDSPRRSTGGSRRALAALRRLSQLRSGDRHGGGNRAVLSRPGNLAPAPEKRSH